MTTDHNGDTPLSLLFKRHYEQNNFLKKAVFLLMGLTPAQQIALLDDIQVKEKNSSEKITALKRFLKLEEKAASEKCCGNSEQIADS